MRADTARILFLLAVESFASKRNDIVWCRGSLYLWDSAKPYDLQLAILFDGYGK